MSSDPIRQRGWSPSRLFGPDRFGVVLVLLLLTTLVFPGLTSGRQSIQGLLIGLSLVAALRASAIGATWAWRGAIGGVVVVGLTVVAGQAGADAVAAGLLIVVLLSTMILIGRRLAAHRRVTLRTVLGGITLYYLLSTIWAYLYVMVDVLLEQPLFTQGPATSPFDYFYFSVVTITTLGYGDLTPAEDIGRSLASLEAFVGQVFLVTLVARLVSLWGRERPPRVSQ